MTDCQICSALFSLIQEYSFQLKEYDEIIEYYNHRWIHVTIHNCHPSTCHSRYKDLKKAENERWIISNKHKEAHIELTKHYREDHL